MKSLGIFYLLFITLSQFVFTYSNNINEYAECEQKKLGYPCCEKNNSVVYYHDEDGDWGYDFIKNEWCGIATVQYASQVTPKQGGNYVIYIESEIDKNDPKFNGDIQSYINQIGQIIINNLDTFEDKAKLEQFQNEFKVIEGDIEKVQNYNQVHFMYNYKGHLVFMAYLNENILNDIKSIPNVSTVEPEINGIVDDIINQKVEEVNTIKVSPKQGGNYVIYIDSEIDKNDPNFNGDIQSYINQIGQIIINNLDTFEDKAKLEQFQNEFKVIEGDIEKVQNYNQVHFMYNYKGHLVFMAYLNENILNDIKSIPNVSTVEPEINGIVDDIINQKVEEVNTIKVSPKQGGNYVIYIDSEIDKNDPNFNGDIQSYINQIGQIIINNLDTFEDKAKLEQFQNEFKVIEGDVEKVQNYNQVHFMYNYNGHLVFMAYLNENILNDIKSIPNVSTVEPEINGTFDDSININENDVGSQCEQSTLGYSCCKEGNTDVYYHDENGDWGYDFDDNVWCIIGIAQQYASPITHVTPKQGGNYVIYVDSNINKNDPKFNNNIQSYIDQIGQIILNNLDTFEDKAILEQFQSEFKVNDNEKIEKLKNYNQIHYMYTYNGHSVFMAYLNKNIIDDIKEIPNVTFIEPETNGSYA